MPKRVKVFTLLVAYLPGYKAGGALRTVSNMVDRLGDRLDFYIYCRDRDVGETQGYAGVKADAWNAVGKAMVYYAKPRWVDMLNLCRRLREINPDYIYLNSFFSPSTFRYLLLRKFGLVARKPVVIAPRGEFSEGARALKFLKKSIYLKCFMQGIRLYDGLIWQASSSIEESEISKVIGSRHLFKVAPDLPMRTDGARFAYRPKPEKRPGEAKFVFCSRISPKKNLHRLFPIMARLHGSVSLDVYGPSTEDDYLKLCMDSARFYGDRLAIRFHGSILHEKVLEILSDYHYFILPTLGENFGHAILEGFLAGCPVLISNQTPWRNLRGLNVGWDLPVDSESEWQEVLQNCVDCDAKSYTQMSIDAHRFGLEHVSNPPLEDNFNLFTPCP